MCVSVDPTLLSLLPYNDLTDQQGSWLPTVLPNGIGELQAVIGGPPFHVTTHTLLETSYLRPRCCVPDPTVPIRALRENAVANLVNSLRGGG